MESETRTTEPEVPLLDAKLAAAFPEVAIDRRMIDEPTSNWSVYEDVDDLVQFQGKTWTALDPELLIRHTSLPIYAGDVLWRATLPAYLRYLLHERKRFTDVPYHTAGQLRRRDEDGQNEKRERRMQSLSQQQLDAIREVVAYLATVPLIDEVMTQALATLNAL